MVAGQNGATRPDSRCHLLTINRRSVSALIGAAVLGVCLLAVSLGTQRARASARPIVLEGTQKGKSQGSSTSDLQKQLLKAKELFDGAPPVPSDSSSSTLPGPSSPGAASSTSTPRRGDLGLKGMSQQEFEQDVDGAVTKKVAQVLLRTMQPLKRVLYEQQKKIEELRHEKNREVEAEKRIAARLSDNLKKGLLTHLKSDVDIEVKRVLSPKDLLRAEKSKKALQKKLERAKAVKSKAAEKAKQADVRSAVKHSMSKALNGVYEAEKKAKEADSKRAAAVQHHAGGSSSSPPSTKKCDPLAGLYKSGIVSWC